MINYHDKCLPVLWRLRLRPLIGWSHPQTPAGPEAPPSHAQQVPEVQPTLLGHAGASVEARAAPVGPSSQRCARHARPGGAAVGGASAAPCWTLSAAESAASHPPLVSAGRASWPRWRRTCARTEETSRERRRLLQPLMPPRCLLCLWTFLEPGPSRCPQ